MGGWAKWRGGAKKVLSYRKGGTKKFSVVKGGSKKFGQIESIMNLKMHNLLLKLTGYSLKLNLYFKIFPGPSVGPALHLTLKMPPLAQPQEHLALFCLESQVAHNHTEGGFRIYPLPYLTRARDDGLSIHNIQLGWLSL